MTLLFEGAGSLLPAARNLHDQNLADAVWRALFHSVSAFCNGGFAPHNSLSIQAAAIHHLCALRLRLEQIPGLGVKILSQPWIFCPGEQVVVSIRILKDVSET